MRRLMPNGRGRYRTGLPVALALALFAGQPVQAWAASTAEAAAPDGAAYADACSTCHGVEGRSAGAVPSIAGIDPKTFVAAMHDFRDGKGDATIMNRIARGYTDPEIEALAGYFSTVKP